MTLREWQEQTGEAVNAVPKLPGRMVSNAITGMKRTWLWHLEDYKVTTVAGGTILLLPNEDFIIP